LTGENIEREAANRANRHDLEIMTVVYKANYGQTDESPKCECKGRVAGEVRLEGILYFAEKTATSTLDKIRIHTRGMPSEFSSWLIDSCDNEMSQKKMTDILRSLWPKMDLAFIRSQKHVEFIDS